MRKVEVLVMANGRISVDTYWDTGIRSIRLSGHTFITGWQHILTFLRRELRDDVNLYIHHEGFTDTHPDDELAEFSNYQE